MKVLIAILAETFGVPHDDPRVQNVILELKLRGQVEDRRGDDQDGQDRRAHFRAIKAAIATDPCRNWLTVARRYHVSRRTVYRAWKMVG